MRSAYLRQECVISIAINVVLSLAFFLGMFGLDPTLPVRVGGAGGYALDLLPQSFMIALMSALVPGLITARRIGTGRIAGVPETRRRIVVRSVLTGLVALALGAAIAFALTRVAGDAVIAWSPALALKLTYGAALAAIVTPIGLHFALRHADLS